MASSIGSSSAWGVTMTAETADRTLAVFFPGWVLDDRSLAPAVGDLVEEILTFSTTGSTPSPCSDTVRATARPAFGHTPLGDPEGGPRWLLEVAGDGWVAAWWSDRPVRGRVELTGRFVVGLDSGGSDDPAPVRGRVRRVRVVEQRLERTGTGGVRIVDGTERLTEVEATPHRLWTNWDMPSDDEQFIESGVLVDLDLDDVPTTGSEFVAGAVSVDGPDVWVMDRSNPVLLHVDTASAPPRIVEYLLPLTIEPPEDRWTRAVHAHGGGCWITSPYDVFRCDRAGDGALTVERVCTDGGRGVVDAERLFILGSLYPMLRSDRRHGVVRDDPDPHPVRMLDDEGRLIPVDDPATSARVRAAARRADKSSAADGTEWVADVGLTAHSPDGTRRVVELDNRSRGSVRWIQSDPFGDPANADIMALISEPPPCARSKD
ncbi:hypothetical protein CBI38_29405 [Rhodococcus oxybenzonivorans]|uniref:Uncharacterized protein n=1 Tax=Rhodococcus oxybenzonivorans TaxID=1990687 RepID=A0A2S2C2C9_9NOCA|nr:hypothetical protein [Rhodococcus oxybenzonivorans]AWK75056.1 hypothetical protein CBI38_29405 [Rhodococcus oxybenzonivorans]